MAKISEMDKPDLRNYMIASREIYRYGDTPAWQRAIKLYKATGNMFDDECTGCRRRLVEWLNG